jgi:hypothetical protein
MGTCPMKIASTKQNSVKSVQSEFHKHNQKNPPKALSYMYRKQFQNKQHIYKGKSSKYPYVTDETMHDAREGPQHWCLPCNFGTL